MRRVVVVVPGNERGGAATHLGAYAAAVARMGLQEEVHFLSCGDGPLYNRLQAMGFDDVLHGSFPSLVRGLRQRMRKDAPALWHFNGPRLNLLGRLAAGGRTPYTSTVHSHPYKDFLASGWKTTVFTRLNMASLRSAVGLFVGSRAFADLFPNTPCFWVPNAVEPPDGVREAAEARARNAADWRQRLGLEDADPLVGVVARFDPVKDIATVIRALALLPQTHGRRVHLVLAGDGNLRTQLEETARRAGVAERVHFLGFVEDPSSLYDAIDLHVSASTSEGESPYVVLEAGAHGVPTVASDIVGHRNLIDPGRTGWLFPTGDAAALAATLQVVFADSDRAAETVAAFQRDVLPRFSPEAMVRAYLAGYAEMGVIWPTRGEAGCTSRKDEGRPEP
ncbi:MAG: glycosyltransferase [Alicyclobacillus mali]|uniref:glycosyltransferase n=1 Tax=Alicyclobacillus mali (ex Roth et al. 2021) TaxID=1123961 RepID=UPI0023F4AC7F|nr:glycosyltransferase [Alicyclobacillus mali (ex Roth et al. 2021)]MCL6487348.1 glycosyltransferase [Alicyclobacillus mali (ex Roth et al. 2021)]